MSKSQPKQSLSAIVETRNFNPDDAQPMLEFIVKAVLTGGQFSGVFEEGSWRVTTMTPPPRVVQPEPEPLPA